MSTTRTKQLLSQPNSFLPQQAIMLLAQQIEDIMTQLAADGGGDVGGPGLSVNNNIAVWNGVTGKLLADGGQTIAQVIAAALAGAILPDGSVPFTGPQLFDSGAVGAPGIAFVGQADMGIRNISAVQMGVSISGALVGGFDASGLFTGTISEQVVAAGVTIDGVLCKDSEVTASVAGDSTKITADGLTIVRSAGGSMTKKFIKVSLSAAQIKGANTTPVDVIPAPGAGKAIANVQCMYKYTFVTTPFSASNQFHLDFTSTLVDEIGVLVSMSTALAGLATVMEQMLPNIDLTQYRSIYENEPLRFMSDADSAAGDCTIDLYIDYSIITL